MLAALIDQYLTILNSLPGYTFSLPSMGRKYHRIIEQSTLGMHRAVHCFVDDDGNVFKAAGWKAPALNGPRFNLHTDMEKIRAVADPYGSYLYKR